MACDRRRRARRLDGDTGAVIVVVAATLATILIIASLVINLGGARHAREKDQNSADAMALAGAAHLSSTGGSNLAACTAAWNYAVSDLGVTASPAPSCTSMSGDCDADHAREVTVTQGSFTITFVNPVPNGHVLFAAQPATSTDATPCERFGVEITHVWHYPFDRGDPTLHVNAMARFLHAKGEADAPLIVLEPHGCGVLSVTGKSHITAVTSTGLPGYIAIDSDGSSCGSGNKVIVDATGSAQLSAGTISMWALSTGNSAKAYDPADVGPGKAFDPAPVASSAPVGRTSIDWRYNCLASNGCPTGNTSAIATLVAADGGSGVPAGFTRWSSLYSCTVNSDLTVAKGNWYVDCPGGLNVTSTLTFRGGDIVTDGSISLSGNGNFRVNCDVASPSTTCPTDPPSPSTLYLRSGDISKTGTTQMSLIETFVYFANGSMDLSGTGTLTWTAPNDPTYPFDNLLVWTESSATIPITGNTSTTLDGIFFAPNATLAVSGDTSTNALETQMFVRQVSLVGNTDLRLAPREDRMVKLGGAGGALIR